MISAASFFLFTLSSLAFAQAQSPITGRLEYAILGDRIKFVEMDGLLVDEHCAAAGVADCMALESARHSEKLPRNKPTNKTGPNPAAPICAALGGVFVTGFDAKKNETGFCQFEDESLVEGFSLLVAAQKRARPASAAPAQGQPAARRDASAADYVKCRTAMSHILKVENASNGPASEDTWAIPLAAHQWLVLDRARDHAYQIAQDAAPDFENCVLAHKSDCHTGQPVVRLTRDLRDKISDEFTKIFGPSFSKYVPKSSEAVDWSPCSAVFDRQGLRSLAPGPSSGR